MLRIIVNRYLNKIPLLCYKEHACLSRLNLGPLHFLRSHINGEMYLAMEASYLDEACIWLKSQLICLLLDTVYFTCALNLSGTARLKKRFGAEI